MKEIYDFKDLTFITIKQSQKSSPEYDWFIICMLRFNEIWILDDL